MFPPALSSPGGGSTFQIYDPRRQWRTSGRYLASWEEPRGPTPIPDLFLKPSLVRPARQAPPPPSTGVVDLSRRDDGSVKISGSCRVILLRWQDVWKSSDRSHSTPIPRATWPIVPSENFAPSFPFFLFFFVFCRERRAPNKLWSDKWWSDHPSRW